MRSDFHRSHAEVVIQVQDFFAIAVPHRQRTVPHQEPASRLREGHDINLTVSRFERCKSHPISVRRKDGITRVVLLLKERKRLAVAEHGHHPYIEVAASLLRSFKSSTTRVIPSF